MYELVERELNTREIRLLKSKVRRYEKEVRPAYRVALVAGLLGYGVAGLIVLAGNLLSKDKTPLWFTLLILVGVGTFLFVSVSRGLLKQNKHVRRMVCVIHDALEHGSVREEIVRSDRMIEVEELEDEGACYLFEVEDRKLLLLFGQEYYSGPKFPSTDFSLVEILDSRKNFVDLFVDKRGEKLKPYKMISAKSRLKHLIPYDHKFIDCGIGELEEHLTKSCS